MNNLGKFYVYHAYSKFGELLYVGKGTGDRWKHCLSGASNNKDINRYYFMNGEKIQYILGVESEKTQWHNITEGAIRYIKRSDIKFREAPKYVTINGIEFKSVESLLKYVKNNFDLEDGE